jgi:uncharacterized protein YndB with AHSA1/START domain
MHHSPDQSLNHKSSAPHSNLLVIERKYNVPVDQLFNAFTTSDALKIWWWPKGLHSDHVDINFKVGGRYFINMKGDEKGGAGMTGDFEEIVKNKRIVMTDSFSDENGKAISAKEAKIPGEWPELVYITFDFEPINSHTSRVILSQQGIPNEGQKDCKQGWSEMFDKLETFFEY